MADDPPPVQGQAIEREKPPETALISARPDTIGPDGPGSFEDCGGHRRASPTQIGCTDPGGARRERA
jgi:hypothetical protein